MRYDASYRETVTLSDGTVVTLRLIRPEDRAGLLRAFERLSPTTRRRRFLAEMPRLSEAMARYLTEVDGRDHLALVATRDSLDMKEEEGVGVARFFRLLEEPKVAEAAVTVVDSMQGRGLGRVLLSRLTEAARERGITTFRASVLSDNEPMRRILDASGAQICRVEGDTVVADVSIAEEGTSFRDWPLFRLFRIAAAIGREAILDVMGS